MVKKLNKKNEKVLLDFLRNQKEWNLFMIGDLLNFGFEEDFLEYWGDYNIDDSLNAVLMRFYRS